MQPGKASWRRGNVSEALKIKGVVERREKTSRDRKGLVGDEAVGMLGHNRGKEQPSFVGLLTGGACCL